MIKKKRNYNARKGITIAETAVAIAVICIVSAAVTTVALISANIEKKTILAVAISNSAENAVECFRFSDSKDIFFQNIAKTADYRETSENTFVTEGDNFKVTLVVDYSDPSAPTLSYTAVGQNREVIQSFTYPDRSGGESE